MSGDVQMELYLHEYKMEALSSVLAEQGSSVEKRMQELLDDLYAELVPEQTQQAIRGRIDAECAAELAEWEAARKFAVFRLRENGVDRYLQVDQGMEFLKAARLLRSCLRTGGGADEYMKLLHGPEEITADRFQQMAATRMEDTGRVTGAFGLDFDSWQCSTLDTMNGWMVYDMKDVSAAAYHAQRKQYAPDKEQWKRFTEKLDGKALAYQPVPCSGTFLTGCRRLRPNDISLFEDIEQEGHTLKFTVIVDDPEDVFSLTVDRDTTDDFICIFGSYDIEHRCVGSTLEVYLDRGDTEQQYQYLLNADERSILLVKMDAYCQQQTGQTLAEYSAQLMAEELAPPTGPVM